MHSLWLHRMVKSPSKYIIGTKENACISANQRTLNIHETNKSIMQRYEQPWNLRESAGEIGTGSSMCQ